MLQNISDYVNSRYTYYFNSGIPYIQPPNIKLVKKTIAIALTIFATVIVVVVKKYIYSALRRTTPQQRPSINPSEDNSVPPLSLSTGAFHKLPDGSSLVYENNKGTLTYPFGATVKGSMNENLGWNDEPLTVTFSDQTIVDQCKKIYKTYDSPNYFIRGYFNKMYNGVGEIHNKENKRKGEFKKAKLDGNGELTQGTSTIKGQFKQDKPHGKITQFFTGGLTYEGNYKDNQWVGNVKVTHSDGSEFNCKYLNKKIKYKTEIITGLFDQAVNGSGTIKDENCLRVGEFKNGRLNGRGMMEIYNPTPKTIAGIFKNDVKVVPSLIANETVQT